MAQGQLNVIEVKYYNENVRNAMERIRTALTRHAFKNVRIILVVVLDNRENVAAAKDRLLKELQSLPFPIDVRVYYLEDLEERFGLTGTTAHQHNSQRGP